MARSHALRIVDDLELPNNELHLSFARSGGPGGQNVNKVETKAILRFDIQGSRTLGTEDKQTLTSRLASRLTSGGEIVVQAGRYRERERNIEDARERLARLLRTALSKPRVRKPTHPGRASRERRLAGKRRRSQQKQARQEKDG